MLVNIKSARMLKPGVNLKDQVCDVAAHCMYYLIKFKFQKPKLWSSGKAHCSQSEGRGFDPHPMLDGSVKVMSRSITTPNSVFYRKEKIQVAKWSTPKN